MKPLILKGHTRPLTCVKYSAEGDLLFSTAKDNTPCIWYTDNGERLGTLTSNGHQGAVWSIDVDSTTTFCITGGGDQTAKLWHVPTGTCLRTYKCSGPVRVVAFSEGCKSFLCMADPFNQKPGCMRVFEIPTEHEMPLPTTTATSSPDDDHQVSSQKPIYDWLVEDLPEDQKLNVASWMPLNEAIITGDTVGVLRIHNPSTGKVLRRIDAHAGKISCLSWNSTKTLFITGGADYKALLFDSDNFSIVKKYESNTPVNAAVISPIKEHVLVAGGQEAMNVTTTSSRVGKFETKFFHMVFQEEWGSVKGHFGPVNALAIHPEGTGFVSGSEDGYIRLHNFDKDYFTMHSEFDDLTALEELAKVKQ